MSNTIQNLQAEWHPTKNDKPLTSYLPYSKHTGYWICEKGHEWEARIAHRTNGTRCPYCSNRKLLEGFNDLATTHPDIAKEWHPTLNRQQVPHKTTYGASYKASWLCDKGHEWEDSVSNRTSNNRPCPYCSGAKAIAGETDLATLHPHLIQEWDESNTGTMSSYLPYSSKKVKWKCMKGHSWEAVIAKRVMGNNCPYCSNQKILTGTNDFQTTHNNSHILKEWSKDNTSKPNLISAGSSKKIIWECPNNHKWQATISSRLRGTGCPYCSNRKVLEGYNDLATTHPHLVEEWSNSNQTDLTKLISGRKEKHKWVCTKGHAWEATPEKRKQGTGCPNCKKSAPEKELYEYLTETLGLSDVQTNDRTLLNGMELDFYIPSKKKAIEFNGLYWHSEEQGKDKRYHYSKWKACKELGIQLIQIWEDDWANNNVLVTEMLSHKLGLSTQPKIFARNTQVKEVTTLESNLFLESNHIQGQVKGALRYGLYTKDNILVALMVLNRNSGSEGKTLNLLRFCTSNNIPGGFTKLLNHVTRSNEEVKKIITFSDNCVSNGALYAANGFIADKELPPDYMYIANGSRQHKFGYRLNRFKTDPKLKYAPGISERKLASLNKLNRVWDAGKIRWVKLV